MIASSTPLVSRKRKASDLCLTPGVSPIRRRESIKTYVLPKLPKGITVEVLRTSSTGTRRKYPLSENTNIINVPKKPRNCEKYEVRHSSRVSSAHFKPTPIDLEHSSKKNQSQFPDLVVISDSDEDAEVAQSVHLKVRKSTRKTIVHEDVVSRIVSVKLEPGTSTVPATKASRFTMNGSTRSTRSTKIKQENRTQAFCPMVKEDDTYAFAESQRPFSVNRTTLPYRLTNRPQAECPLIVEEKTDAFSENHRLSSEITKFSLADVDSWIELKMHPGVYYSKKTVAYSGGDGDAFPAGSGYFKLAPKTKMDILGSANNVVFTAVKGKVHLKSQPNLAGGVTRTEMAIGDIMTVPRGSKFTMINSATKNDFVMSYVKL